MTAVQVGSDISILPDSAYQLVKEIFIAVKNDYQNLLYSEIRSQKMLK